MKAPRLLIVAILLFSAAAEIKAAEEVPASKIRVLLITGGHGFEQEGFFQLFRTNTDLSVTEREHPNADAMLKADRGGEYDVIVLYDMRQDSSDEAKADFIARLKEG